MAELETYPDYLESFPQESTFATIEQGQNYEQLEREQLVFMMWFYTQLRTVQSLLQQTGVLCRTSAATLELNSLINDIGIRLNNLRGENRTLPQDYQIYLQSAFNSDRIFWDNFRAENLAGLNGEQQV